MGSLNEKIESCLTSLWRLCSMLDRTLSWLDSEAENFLLPLPGVCSMYEICVSCLHRMPFRGSMYEIWLSWRDIESEAELCFDSMSREPLLSCFSSIWRELSLSCRYRIASFFFG